jgi:hypothetical protein
MSYCYVQSPIVESSHNHHRDAFTLLGFRLFHLASVVAPDQNPFTCKMRAQYLVVVVGPLGLRPLEL